MSRTVFASAGSMLLLVTVLGHAQDAADPKAQFVAAQKANKAALREYTWKRRTELKLKGESKKITLEQMRYDIDGKLQKTPLDAGAGAAAPPKSDSGGGGRGGRRGGRVKENIIENKKEEFAGMMKGLAQLVGSYGQLPQEKLAAFVKGATTNPGEGAEAGTMKIAGTNVLMDKDSLSIWIDPKTKMIRRIELGSLYEDKPVSAISEYKSLDNGVTYQARATLQYPEKQVEVIIENFDYQHTGAAH